MPQKWIEGEWKFLCATRVLKAGINVQNLPLVLPCGEPWGLESQIDNKETSIQQSLAILVQFFLFGGVSQTLASWLD